MSAPFKQMDEQHPMMDRIRQAIEDHPKMPTLYRDLMNLLKDPDADYEQLAKIIRNDPGVTMNILRVANSTYFSGEERIDSLRKAFVRLGSRHLFQIIIAQGVATRLAQPFPGYDLDPRELLQHSVGVAITAEHFARLLNVPALETLFTAGLLHDMGKVILDPYIKEKHVKVRELLQDTTLAFDEIELACVGITHAKAGALLMEKWLFPDAVLQLVELHHRPEEAKQFDMETLMVHFADTLLYSQGVGDGLDGFRYPVDNDAANRLGLRPRDVEQLASGLLDQLNELESMM